MPSVRAVSQPALTKLRPPRLGRVFEREHLFAQLDVGDADPASFVHVLRAAAALVAPRRQLRFSQGDAQALSTFHHSPRLRREQPVEKLQLAVFATPEGWVGPNELLLCSASVLQ